MAALSRPIFDIEGELVQIAEAFDLLAECGEKQPVLDALEAYFGNLLDERDRKLDGYARLIKRYEAHASARRKEAHRLLELASTDENNVKRLKTRLHDFFVVSGINNTETTYHKFWVQNNGGALPLVVADEIDLSRVPERFLKKVLDTDRVREALEAGEVLEFARLGERGSHVRIK